ncbi:MAG: hypothetical protein KDA45_09205 [Planctomycetales bacterium]|nr:hypothetical protein [Planctomycetales bacterium]
MTPTLMHAFEIQPLTLQNSVAVRKTSSLSSWQLWVMPGKHRPASDLSRSQSCDFLRFDTPHQAVPDPWFLTQWREDIGWHRSLADLWDPMQAVKPATRDAAIVTASPAADIPAVSGRAGVQRQSTRYGQMLAEAAHDIRAPIAVAQQILVSLAERLKSGQRLTQGDAELLDVAKLRLVQANRWAEGILLDQSLEHGQAVNIRSRFYPQQWQAEIRPLLESLAMQRHVRLEWRGWDRSLPRLYLDTNQLSRAVLNVVTNAIEASAPGGRVSIRVAWQTNVTQQCIVVVEDSGRGLDAELMRRVNASEIWPAATAGDALQGIGLRTAKSLIRGLGGSICAQRRSSGGTTFRFSLPVDNYHSLVRGWLRQNADAAAASEQNVAQTIVIHAVRCSLKSDAEQLDRRLQQAASGRELVYRVAQDRWLWIGLTAASAPGRTAPAADKPSLARVLEAWQAERQNVAGARGRCFEQLVYRLSGVTLADLHSVARARYRLPQVTAAIAEKMAQLMGAHIPPVDELSERGAAMLIRPLQGGPSRRIRQDQPQVENPGWHAEATKLATRAGAGPERMSLPVDVAPRPRPTLAESCPESFSGTIAELAQQWHAAQARLDRLQAKMSMEIPALKH